MWIDLSYPDVDNNYNKILINLSDVRAADPIKVWYDKKRDGWIIQVLRDDFEEEVFIKGTVDD